MREAPPVLTLGFVTAAPAGVATANAAIKPAASIRRVMRSNSLLVMSPNPANSRRTEKSRYSSATSAPETCCGGPSGPKSASCTLPDSTGAGASDRR
jgi:hypothetical protein